MYLRRVKKGKAVAKPTRTACGYTVYTVLTVLQPFHPPLPGVHGNMLLKQRRLSIGFLIGMSGLSELIQYKLW